MNVYVNVCIIVNITIIIILCIYLCTYIFHFSILAFLMAYYLKIPTTLQYNLEGPTVCKCVYYYLHHYLYVFTFVCVSPQQPLHFYWHICYVSIKYSLLIVPQSTYKNNFKIINLKKEVVKDRSLKEIVRKQDGNHALASNGLSV